MEQSKIIGKNQMVMVNYELKDDDGEVLDASEKGQPLDYLHGHGQIVAGLERALEGKTEGDRVQLKVAPDDGYGQPDPERVFAVPRKQFEFEVSAGDVVQAQMPNGQFVPLTVREVSEEQVKVDANHPLAGMTLHFDVEVVEVRPATEEEKNAACNHGDHEGCSCSH